MSTEPGKNKGGPPGAAASGTGGAGKKPAASPSKSGTKPSKTVAAASAKSGRDETTVDLEPGKPAAAEDSAGADTTRIDLAKIEEKPAKDADTPEIAPVKDTADDSSSSSSSSPGSAGWAKPAEPSGSVSAGRTESASKPFKPTPGNSATPAAAAGGGSGSSSPSSPSSDGAGRGFAGTVLKDRPSTAMAPANSAKPANGKPARKAQLQLARLEPWSVMKFSFVMSLVCFVVLLVAVIVLYVILSGLGVFDAISDTINSLTREQGETTGSVDAGNWFSFFRVFGYTVLVGALNVMLITALSTVGSVIYNLAADLVGGVEVTLKEAE
ncbi:DUF3566 domain-containing protein [Actinomadura sp. BRA 177]|uniref:DUF3566 domain-containing protein n=1 Tax=Actinomadura sp. BRA 177 TaxID=2745202 RepID=UPI002814DF99|nr:DUF3566 domain-containing protein [Actinomadura sp. BRA 177]